MKALIGRIVLFFLSTWMFVVSTLFAAPKNFYFWGAGFCLYIAARCLHRG